MPIFDPSAGTPELNEAIWRAYCGVATCVNTKQLGETDKALEELQTQLHEHAAQLREVVPLKRRLCHEGAPDALAKRLHSSAPSSDDEESDSGEEDEVDGTDEEDEVDGTDEED